LIGNDRPFTVSGEYWYSEELQMNIILKHTDPQHGTQVVRLTKLNRAEPDETMFEIPAQYKFETRVFSRCLDGV
jgi:hypothetical protein